MSNEMISVLMSVHNGERYLRESIDSILKQSCQDFEFIIVDDASTDETTKILRSYSDARIRLLKNGENMGLTWSLNRGLEVARGRFVARQDADDISSPQRLEIEQRFLRANADTLVVSSNIEFMSHDGRRLGESNRACAAELVPWFLLFYNHLGGHSQVMFRRQVIKELGGYCEATRYSQDYELWQRVSRVGQITILPDVLIRWRRHGDSISTKSKQEQERFSLENSRRALQTLLRRQLNTHQVAKLRQFWLGPFPSGADLAEVHDLLARIYRAFSRERLGGPKGLALRHHLRRTIANQFVYWRYGFDRYRELNLKLRASFCASMWHPGSLLAGPVKRYHA